MRFTPGELELTNPLPPRLMVSVVCLIEAIHVNICVSIPFLEGIPDDHPSLACSGSLGAMSGGLPFSGHSQQTCFQSACSQLHQGHFASSGVVCSLACLFAA